MLSVDKNIKKCLNQGIKKMFSTTPKRGTTVLRKHKRWLFLWQKTAALSKWFKCSTILNKLLLLDEVEQNIVICQWQAINYLPKYFAITEFNNSFIIWSPSFFFVMNILGKRSNLPFSCKSNHKKEKSVVSFTHEWNIICHQTQLDEIAHEQTIICGQLFAAHMVGPQPMKRKKTWLRMTILPQSYTTINECRIFLTLTSQY